MRLVLLFLALMVLGSCSRGFQLDLRHSAADGSLSVAAFQLGVVWGREPVTVCPERIIIEELAADGPIRIWERTKEVQRCVPRHRWSFVPKSESGKPLFADSLSKPISVTFFGNGWHAGTGWTKP